MSKLDIRNAIRENGINCEFEGQPGKVLLVTEAMLDQFPAPEDAKQPEVSAGEAIVSYMDRAAGVVRGRVLVPGAENDLSMMIRADDGEINRIYIGNMTAFPNAIRSAYDLAGNVSGKQAAALEAFEDYAETVFANVLGQSRFAAPENISAALSFELEGSRRQEAEETRLTAEQLDLITTARGLRQAIGRVSPDHADALAPTETYQSHFMANDLVANLRVRSADLPAQARAALRADRALSEEVFGAITTTPIFELTAKIIDPKSHEDIRQKLRPGLIRNGFAAVIEQRLSDIFDKRMKDYEYEFELYTKDGADIMLVRDHMQGHAVSYVYGWDTDSRKIEVEGKLALSEADVPTAEEIARLREVLADMRYEIGGDVTFDMFDGDNDDFDQDEMDFDDLFDDEDPDGEDDDLTDLNY